MTSCFMPGCTEPVVAMGVGRATCNTHSYSKAWIEGEAVDHPSHYGGDTVYEAIKVIEAWELDFHLGNTVKYISRAGKKPGADELSDLRKARWYLDRAIERKESRSG